MLWWRRGRLEFPEWLAVKLPSSAVHPAIRTPKPSDQLPCCRNLLSCLKWRCSTLKARRTHAEYSHDLFEIFCVFVTGFGAAKVGRHECRCMRVDRPPVGFGAKPWPPNGYYECKYPEWSLLAYAHVKNVFHSEHKLALWSSVSMAESNLWLTCFVGKLSTLGQPTTQLSISWVIHVFTWILEVETFNNGRLGLRVAVWLHRSKSVSTGLSCCDLG